MKILFFNHNGNSEVAAAGEVIRNVCVADDFESLSRNWPEQLYKDEKIGVCIFHGYPSGFSEEAIRENAIWSKPKGMVICFISTSPLERVFAPITSGGTTHWKICVPNTRAVRLIGGEKDELKKNWQALLEVLTNQFFIKTAPATGDLGGDLQRFLNPDYREPIMALRLLCEAKRAVVNAKTLHPTATASGLDTNTITMNGITIRAPATIAEWLRPFGGQTRDDISKVAAVIGSGEISRKAECVLKAAADDGDLNEAIDRFLGSVANL